MGRICWCLVGIAAWMGASAWAQPRLVEVGAQVGVVHLAGPGPTVAGGGVAIFDYDRDGRPDLLFAQDGGCWLYRNEAGGEVGLTFREVSAESGMASVCRGRALAVLDYDRDGWEDVAVGGAAGVLLLRNEAGHFTDHTALAGLGGETGAAALSAADVDRDGYPDLYVGRYVTRARFPVHECGANRFYRNRGDGTFAEAAQELGIDDAGCALAATWVDLDGDGALDLVVANDFGAIVAPNRVYRQEDGQRFRPVGSSWGAAAALYAMGLAVADVDGDGRLDLFFTNIGRNLLLRNGGAGFVDETDAWGLGWPFAVISQEEGLRWRSSWGAVFLDLDLDGKQELYVAAGYLLAEEPIANARVQPNGLFVGQDQVFELDPDQGGDPRSSRGVSAGDLDGDGAPDLVVSNVRGSSAETEDPRPAVYLAVPPAGRHSLAVRLVGTVSAPKAAGARVEVHLDGGERLVRVVDAGGASHGSQHAPTVHFGLGAADAGEVLVRWPSGVSTQHGPLAAGAAYVLEEPEWLRVPRRVAAGEVVVLEAAPLDSVGRPLGSGHSVVFRPSAGTLVGTVSDLGDGRYRQQWRAPASSGAGMVQVEVDGAALPARPRVLIGGGDRTLLGVAGAPVRIGETFTAVVWPRDAAGEPLGAAHQVEVERVGVPGFLGTTDLGDGRYEVSVPAPVEPGQVVLRARVDGTAQERSWGISVVSGFDPEGSRLEVSPAVGGPGEQVVVRAWVVDGDGRPGWPAADLRLESSAGELIGSPASHGLGIATQRLRLPETPGEVQVRAWQGGVPFARVARAQVLTAGEAVAPSLLDGPGSRLFPFHSVVPADGRSTVAVLVAARDVNGGYLPATAGTVVRATGGRWRGPTRQALGNAAVRCLIAPAIPGTVEVSGWISGVPLGGSARIDFQAASPDGPAVDGCGPMDAFAPVPELAGDGGAPQVDGGGPPEGGDGGAGPVPWVGGGGGAGCRQSGGGTSAWSVWWVLLLLLRLPLRSRARPHRGRPGPGSGLQSAP